MVWKRKFKLEYVDSTLLGIQQVHNCSGLYSLCSKHHIYMYALIIHVPVLLSKVKAIPPTKLLAKTMSPDPTYPYMHLCGIGWEHEVSQITLLT